MKLLLASLLLVLTVHAVPKFSRDACLQTINNGRAAYAEKFQIANMNSLMYNKKMEKSILQQLSFVDGCSEPSIISHNNLDIYLNVRDGGDHFIVDLLSATDNSQMACVKSKCNGEDIISIVTDKSDSTPISGSPGTECPSDRLAVSNGLCDAPKNVRNGYARKFVSRMEIDRCGNENDVKDYPGTFGTPGVRWRRKSADLADRGEDVVKFASEAPQLIVPGGFKVVKPKKSQRLMSNPELFEAFGKILNDSTKIWKPSPELQKKIEEAIKEVEENN